jgi:hypothetical protein
VVMASAMATATARGSRDMTMAVAEGSCVEEMETMMTTATVTTMAVATAMATAMVSAMVATTATAKAQATATSTAATMTTTPIAAAAEVKTTMAAGTDNAYDGAQTLLIHPIWMRDAVSSGLQLNHDTIPSFELNLTTIFRNLAPTCTGITV